MNLTPGEAPAVEAVNGVLFDGSICNVGALLGGDAVNELTEVDDAVAGFTSRLLMLDFRAFLGGSGGGGGRGTRVSPVICELIARISELRHNIVRLTFAGRECHESINVPVARATRRVVIT